MTPLLIRTKGSGKPRADVAPHKVWHPDNVTANWFTEGLILS